MSMATNFLETAKNLKTEMQSLLHELGATVSMGIVSAEPSKIYVRAALTYKEIDYMICNNDKRKKRFSVE